MVTEKVKEVKMKTSIMAFNFLSGIISWSYKREKATIELLQMVLILR